MLPQRHATPGNVDTRGGPKYGPDQNRLLCFFLIRSIYLRRTMTRGKRNIYELQNILDIVGQRFHPNQSIVRLIIKTEKNPRFIIFTAN